MSIRQALWLVGLIEAAIATYLAFGKTQQKTKLICVAWLGGNFLLYRVAAAILTVGKPCPCLGSITEKLPLPPAIIDWILSSIVLYLFCGSLFFLLARSQQPSATASAGGEGRVVSAES